VLYILFYLLLTYLLTYLLRSRDIKPIVPKSAISYIWNWSEDTLNKIFFPLSLKFCRNLAGLLSTPLAFPW